MAHPFPLREIARQAGLSEATVDRVVNHRGGVRESTAAEVHRAVAELRRQRTQLRLTGRTFLVDVVMQAPERFSTAVCAALEDELPTLHPATMRCRFHLRETGPTQQLVETLDRIDTRSHGVLLKAPDRPEVVAATDRLVARGVPVVTLVTDLPSSRRLAYVGIDNRAAGATAAYLLGQWLGSHSGNVLVTLSSGFFRGEEEREMGFRTAMRARQADRALVDITDSGGLDATMSALAREALDHDGELRAVYSIGGANRAIVDAFAARGRECAAFIAHDLDQDNVTLLRHEHISAVLHHDLHSDVRRACQLIMQAHEALPATPHATASAIQVVTPFNLPPTW